MKHLEPMVLKTWNEWEELGFHVIKGQKSVATNSRGFALFSKEQVTKTAHHNYGYDYEERKTDYPKVEEERKVVYFADGSGYLEAGGPCGRLYFDYNGNI